MSASLQVPQLVNSPSNFAQLQFSMDGQKLLAVCDGSIFVLDAFNGTFLSSMNNGVPDSGAPRQACFSCDSNYILSGDDDALCGLAGNDDDDNDDAWECERLNAALVTPRLTMFSRYLQMGWCCCDVSVQPPRVPRLLVCRCAGVMPADVVASESIKAWGIDVHMMDQLKMLAVAANSRAKHHIDLIITWVHVQEVLTSLSRSGAQQVEQRWPHGRGTWHHLRA